MMPPNIGPGWRRGATRASGPGRLLPWVALSLIVAVAACGDTVVVEMRDNSFAPETLRVEAGARVRFDNTGRAVHNVIIADSATAPFPANPPVTAPGASQRLRFDKAGTYRIYCSYHGTPDGRGMAGTVVVGGVR